MLKYSLSDFYLLYAYSVLFWGVVYSIIAWLKRKFKKTKNELLPGSILYFFLLSVSFSCLGLTIGLLIGLSISPVIGVVIPALLTFFGGFITYAFVFGNKKEEDGYIMIIILFTVSFFLILGSDYGASMRAVFQQETRDIENNEKRAFEEYKNNLLKGSIRSDEARSILDTSRTSKKPENRMEVKPKN